MKLLARNLRRPVLRNHSRRTARLGQKVLARAKDADLFVVRTQDPDAIAENLGPWRAQTISVRRNRRHRLSGACRWPSSGFSRVVITSDHGHVMLPEVPPGDVVESPARRLVGKYSGDVGWGPVFRAGAGTINLKAGHRGHTGRRGGNLPSSRVSCLFPPVRDISPRRPEPPGGRCPGGGSAGGQGCGGGAGEEPDIEIRYRLGPGFTSRVIGLNLHLQGDIFGTPRGCAYRSIRWEAARRPFRSVRLRTARRVMRRRAL